MKIKKALALVIAAVMLLSITACKKNPTGDTSSLSEEVTNKGTKGYMTLLYSAADTFNPYTLKTDINRQLCKLLYEPLVKLDNEFNPVYSVAESVVIEGNKCTVKIKSLKFSDGSDLTADDVVYSYKLAKNSQSAYSAKLYEVNSATAADSHTVVFSLTKNDPYFVNVLDFPILKSGSDNITDSDSVLQPPIGCGRFKVSDDRLSLVFNDMCSGKKGSITEIKLINAPDSEAVSHYVEVGAADMYYSDISDGNILRMSGKKLDINLNNLVFIGINQNVGALGENALRQALSSGIDRVKLCRDAYYNNALPATGFFNPVWAETKAVQNIQIEAKSQITVENLEKIGYNSLDKQGYRVSKSGSRLSFSLLVNSENRIRAAAAKMIADQLSAYGIRINVVEKSYADYTACLAEGNFQLFLGEVMLTENMDISALVTEGSPIAYGLKKEDGEASDIADTEGEPAPVKSGEVIKGFYEGNNTIADVASVLQTEMPLIPVCYRTGVLFSNDNIENVENSSADDIYFSIDSYIYNN